MEYSAVRMWKTFAVGNSWHLCNLQHALLQSLILSISNLTMSFRKRNIGISSPSGRIFPPALRASPGDAEPMSPTQNHTKAVAASLTIQGVRPSPLDGRLTTSTGTQSLDNLLAGHRGLALGCSVLLEETGTTDYAGTLLRHYAAEGVVQKHQVYVVGIGEQWGRELPGLVVSSHAKKGENTKSTEDKERMKIAWRYERLGDFTGESSGSRGGIASSARPVHSSIHSFYCRLRLSNND